MTRQSRGPTSVYTAQSFAEGNLSSNRGPEGVERSKLFGPQAPVTGLIRLFVSRTFDSKQLISQSRLYMPGWQSANQIRQIDVIFRDLDKYWVTTSGDEYISNQI